MGIGHWDKDAEGNIVCKPLFGIETAPMRAGMAGLIRIEYLTDPTTDEKRSAVQLAITVNELTRLIVELQVLERQLRGNLTADKPPGRPS